MSIKLLGSVVLLLWAVLLGRYFALGVSRSCNALDEVILLMEYIKRNIVSFHRPIPDILEAYVNENSSQAWLCDLVKNASEAKSIEKSEVCLTEEAFALLVKFSRELGSDYTENEVKKCEYYISAFRAASDRERERLAKNQRLYRFLPPLAVLSLIIVIM